MSMKINDFLHNNECFIVSHNTADWVSAATARHTYHIRPSTYQTIASASSLHIFSSAIDRHRNLPTPSALLPQKDLQVIIFWIDVIITSVI